MAKLNTPSPQYHRYYVYDEAGRLLGEYRPTGTRVAEYVWLDDQLIAVLSTYDGGYYQYVLTDHLATPRAVVHPVSNAILWRWDLTGSAFGDHAVQDDPDGDGLAFTLNLRYPGQYFDGETGLHYNYFRDYDPSTGRYVQSDPIGLEGGIGTYTYVGASPLDQIDVFGLNAVSPTSFPTFGAETIRWSREPSLQSIEQQRLGSAAHCASNSAYCRTPVDDFADAYVDFMAMSCPVAGAAGLRVGKLALRSKTVQRICLASGLGAAACAGKYDDIREVFGDVQRRLEVRQEIRRGTQIENKIRNSISARPNDP